MDEQQNLARTLSNLAVENFRLSSELLAAGDELAKDFNMTSARWQVLGTLTNAERPMTVAQIARRMGLKRQSVQRVTDWLWEQRLADYQPNPRHLRAKLVVPTESGQRVLEKLECRRSTWADDVVAELDADALEVTIRTMRILRRKLGGDEQ